VSDRWPNLDSISIRLPPVDMWDMSPAEVGVLYTLVATIAGQCVFTYSEPSTDPKLPDDPVRLARIVKCSVKQWKNLRPIMDRFFSLSDGHWRLKDAGMIVISRPMTRNALSTAAKAIAMGRDGQRCAYCGTIDGPFHFDHIFPVARGGSDEATNLVLACVPCNMSKGSKTLAEWVGR
jgi:5-methylcytosine-specific restriction endonuclease McrA